MVICSKLKDRHINAILFLNLKNAPCFCERNLQDIREEQTPSQRRSA